MLSVTCYGSPYEIGFQHGQTACTQVNRSIRFYRNLFWTEAHRQWPEVRLLAGDFAAVISKRWPQFYEEMKGIADGSGSDILDIVALNVRTEIAFGLFTDGCTSLYWKSDSGAFLGQNWDWMEEQKPNLVLMTIIQARKPTIKIVNEAGLLGKIGLNSAGVGVCLNAIRAKGIDVARLPTHLGLRMVLECASAREAADILEKAGMASSSHILVADSREGFGCESSCRTFRRLQMDKRGIIIHTNHFLQSHPSVEEPFWLADSGVRLERMKLLVENIGDCPSLEKFKDIFKDEAGSPCAISRTQLGESKCATLFNIVIDFGKSEAWVTLGRPSKPEEIFHLKFDV